MKSALRNHLVLLLSIASALRSVSSFLVNDNHRSLSLSHHQTTLSSSITTTSSFSLETLEGPWNITAFAATQCWGRRPLLLRNAFSDTIITTATDLPSWEDLVELAILNDDDDSSEEEPISSRIIRHQPGQLDSYQVDFGPFDREELLNELRTKDNVDGDVSPAVSTLVLNDVDRAIPAVSDWMDDLFGPFLPRWRRDDAQVSLAPLGAGIGPHVDNYDVFLVQQSGSRQWTVGLQEVSVEMEYDSLVEASEVRVLQLDESSFPTTTVTLNAGDCLYIPPRILHHGTSTSKDCITLSVGCRAPSASDLISKLAETIQDSASKAANERYTDFNLMEQSSQELSKRIKHDMKNLVLAAMDEVLENEAQWDELCGRQITSPNRPSINYPVPLSSMDEEWKNELGVWGDVDSTIDAVLQGKGCLFRAEGVSFACSSVPSTSKEGGIIHRLFSQGKMFELKREHPPNDEGNGESDRDLVNRIANGPPLDKACLGDDLSDARRNFLRQLIDLGYLYGEDNDQ